MSGPQVFRAERGISITDIEARKEAVMEVWQSIGLESAFVHAVIPERIVKREDGRWSPYEGYTAWVYAVDVYWPEDSE